MTTFQWALVIELVPMSLAALLSILGGRRP